MDLGKTYKSSFVNMVTLSSVLSGNEETSSADSVSSDSRNSFGGFVDIRIRPFIDSGEGNSVRESV